MIRCENLAKRFGDRTAVEGVTFDVAPGEIVGLLGPNGGGKTTTMRMIAGLLSPSAGRAEVDGRNLCDDPSARGALGFLTEQPGLYDRLSARENLAFFARVYDVPDAEVDARVDDALALFGLGDRAGDKAGSYSKGMRQRLALARCVLHRPKALLLDEPTSGLDPQAAAEVRATIELLASRGVAILVSTHNLAEAERICARVAIVKNRLLALVADRGLAVARIVLQGDGLGEPVAADLATLPGVREVTVGQGALHLTLDAAADLVPEVVARAVSRGARLRSVQPRRRPLEERYLELVGARTDDAGSVG